MSKNNNDSGRRIQPFVPKTHWKKTLTVAVAVAVSAMGANYAAATVTDSLPEQEQPQLSQRLIQLDKGSAADHFEPLDLSALTGEQTLTVKNVASGHSAGFLLEEGTNFAENLDVLNVNVSLHQDARGSVTGLIRDRATRLQLPSGKTLNLSLDTSSLSVNDGAILGIDHGLVYYAEEDGFVNNGQINIQTKGHKTFAPTSYKVMDGSMMNQGVFDLQVGTGKYSGWTDKPAVLVGQEPMCDPFSKFINVLGKVNVDIVEGAENVIGFGQIINAGDFTFTLSDPTSSIATLMMTGGPSFKGSIYNGTGFGSLVTSQMFDDPSLSENVIDIYKGENSVGINRLERFSGQLTLNIKDDALQKGTATGIKNFTYFSEGNITLNMDGGDGLIGVENFDESGSETQFTVNFLSSGESVGILNKAGHTVNHRLGDIQYTQKEGTQGGIVVKNEGVWVENAENFLTFSDYKEESEDFEEEPVPVTKSYKVMVVKDGQEPEFKTVDIEQLYYQEQREVLDVAQWIKHSDFSNGTLVLEVDYETALTDAQIAQIKELTGAKEVHQSGLIDLEMDAIANSGQEGFFIDWDMYLGEADYFDCPVSARKVLANGYTVHFSAPVTLFGDGEVISDSRGLFIEDGLTIGDSHLSGQGRGGSIESIAMRGASNSFLINAGYNVAIKNNLEIIGDDIHVNNYGQLTLSSFSMRSDNDVLEPSIINHEGALLHIHSKAFDISGLNEGIIENHGKLVLTNAPLFQTQVYQSQVGSEIQTDLASLGLKAQPIVSDVTKGSAMDVNVIGPDGQETVVSSRAFAQGEYEIERAFGTDEFVNTDYQQLPLHITGGKLTINDVAINDIGQQKIRDALGLSPDVELVFTNNGTINVDIAGINRFIQEGYEGYALKDTVLSAPNRLLTVGSSAEENTIGGSIGFKQVLADSLSIADGKTLTILGEDNLNVHYQNVSFTEGALSLGRGDYRLDLVNVAQGQSGHLMTSANASLSVSDIHNNGALNVTNKGTLKINQAVSLGSGGSFVNHGQAFVDSIGLDHSSVKVFDGVLAHGMSSSQWVQTMQGATKSDATQATLALGKTLMISANDTVQVGTMDTTKNLGLGQDSLIVLSGHALKGHAFLHNQGNEKLTAQIDANAQFAFDGKMLGRHYVASGFDAQSEAAFMEHQVKNMASGQMMGMSQDNRGVYIVNGSEHIADIAPDAHFKDAFDFVLQGHQDTQSDNAVIGWISQQLAQGTDKNTIGQATHDLAQTASMIGIAQQGLSQTMQVADQLLTEHSSDGHNLWATTLASDADFSGLDLGYGLSANYKAKNYGLMIGATGEVREGTTVGASMAYISGEVKGSGMKNDTETVAGSLYAKHRAGHWQTRAAVTLAQTDHDAKGSRSVKTDTKAAVLDLGAAYTHEVGNGVAVKPYAGVRVATLKMKGADMSVADKTLVHAQGKSDTFVQVPLGVQFEKTHESDTGWRVQAQANLGVIGTIGNTMSDARVNAIGFSAADTVSAQVLDRVTGQAGFGVTAQTPNGTDMSMSYRFSGSDSVKDHQLQLQVKYRF